MTTMLVRLAIAALVLFVPLSAHAQSGQEEFKALAAKARGQTFSVAVAGEDAYRKTLAEFGKKFGIEVQPTVARPSQHLARLQTEQRSGQYVWDLWIGGTSNMVNTAVPAGMLEPMDKYFVLSEVKDPSNWRHPDFIFNDAKRHVFAHVSRLEFYVLRNRTVLPDVKIDAWNDFLNPALKGRVVIRDLSVPNAGTFAMATMYKAVGADGLKKFLTEQDPKVFDNPQQLESTIYRGGAAASIGLEMYLWDKCRADGGCKEIDSLRQMASVISVGISIPKNPPHPDVSKLWVNWFLSKEGQEVFVREWALESSSGAVSMRKDVPPAKGHEQYLPDFSKPEQYVFVSSERGSAEVDATIKIYKDAVGK
jgi:ABC-type Fe3+ transport system substrate-binding protein